MGKSPLSSLSGSISWLPNEMRKTNELPPPPVLAAYGLFIVSAGGVWHLIAEGAFSAILTLSVMLQCLGVALLGVQVLLSGTAAGISVRTLYLDAMALACRLSSTLWLNGYLPTDLSGDYCFQITDICSFIMILCLLRHVLVDRRQTYQAAEDSLPIVPMTIGSLILASFFHGNMNNRPIFDTLWMASLFLSTIAVLPQLWLITRTGGKVEALTSHNIAAMAAGRGLAGIFMWHARGDVTCIPWIPHLNHAVWAILGAHLVHMVFLGDFAYYYIRAVMTNGINSGVEMESACGV